MQDDRLAGRHVVVTGGAQGIGSGIARRVARAGADVTVFDVDVEGAEETAAAVRDLGGAATAVAVDVADEDAVVEGVATAVDERGSVHGLVNNAGVQRALPVLETSVEEWDRHLAVNARGVFLCSREVGRHMVEAGVEGAIVNIASTAAERAFPGQGAYATSKAGVVGFTKVLAKELADHGITVNAVNPGTVDTPMVQRWLEEHAAEGEVTEAEMLDEALSSHVVQRIGQPEEIGHVVTLLLSGEGDWITAEAINVDGGFASN